MDKYKLCAAALSAALLVALTGGTLGTPTPTPTPTPTGAPTPTPYEEEAEAFVREGIRRGIPMPFLLLRHQDPQFSEITWHWFLLTGYEESGEGLRVVYGTYGERYTALLSSLWDTGHEQKGGILRLCIRPAHGETAG